MRTQWMMLIKDLAKSYLDNYMLPGTNAGTEVLWIYMIQWKRQMANIVFAGFYILLSQADFTEVESIAPNTPSEEGE